MSRNPFAISLFAASVFGEFTATGVHVAEEKLASVRRPQTTVSLHSHTDADAVSPDAVKPERPASPVRSLLSLAAD